MDVQATPSPYTPVGGSNIGQGNPPTLGAQMPGSTGGLPALGGLSATQNPMAAQLQSMGRGEDKMLVHMTPEEVNSLQGLAMASGGSLTINPQTGLPEAGWLGKLLPTILGVAGAAFGLPTWAIGLGVGAGKTAVTGDLSKGLMAGLQAFGGAGLGQAAGLGGELGSVGQSLGLTQSATGAASAASPGVFGAVGTGPASMQGAGAAAEAGLKAANLAPKAPGLLSKFGAETSLGQTGLLGKALPMAAGSAMLGGISDATAPDMPTYKGEENKSNYVPMRAGKRETQFQTPEQMRASGGAEFSYFTPSNPDPEPIYGNRRYAEGGEVGSGQDFDSLVSMYQAQNPGAITASMYPTSPTAAPATGNEVVHNFGRATAGNLGLTDASSLYGTFPGLSGLGGFNFSTADYDTAINRLRGDLGLGSIGGVQPSAPPTMSAPAPMPIAQPPSIRPSPNAPPMMLSPFEGMDYGGPYRTTLPTGPQVEEEKVGYNPGSGGRPVEAYESMMLQEYARGGAVNMDDGSFVVDARTVSELGNGSSNAGIEMLTRIGGRPVRGPGDGVSDSVKASIGGKQEARVARDEVIFSPEAVRRVGGGSEARGTKKLYAMMDKAHKARKKAGRGQDTGLRRGLA